MDSWRPLVVFALGFVSCGTLVITVSLYQKNSFIKNKSDIIQESFLNTKENDKIRKALKIEQLSRGSYFFGEEKQKQLENKYVIVVGLGGVGSHAAHLLARSGIRKLRLIDFDQVSLSSLNRHANATRKDVGTSKVLCTKEFILSFAPWCKVEAIQKMFRKEDAEKLILEGERPDYIIDCIDDIRTKIQLLHYCCVNNLKVISSCGAGAKSDPTRLHITNLSDVANDPLSARIKIELKTRLKGIKTAKNTYKDLTKEEQSDEFIQKIKNIETVYSSEKPQMKLLPLALEPDEDPNEFGIVDNFRIRIMPVLGTMPAIFGIAMASRVITNLVDKQYLPSPMPNITLATADRLRVRFNIRLKKALGENQKKYDFNGVDSEDIEYVVTQLKRRCIVSFGKWQRNKIEIALWNYNDKIKVGNLVLVKKAIAEKLDSLVASKVSPTPELLDISQEHFNSILKLLKLLEESNLRNRTPKGIIDHILFKKKYIPTNVGFMLQGRRS